MIRIAGRTVNINDRLYHVGFQAWGTVTKYDDGSIELTIQGRSEGNYRRLLVTAGGLVNGKREVYWHKPLVLDLPFSDINKLQQVVDLTLELFGDKQ